MRTVTFVCDQTRLATIRMAEKDLPKPGNVVKIPGEPTALFVDSIKEYGDLVRVSGQFAKIQEIRGYRI